MQTSTRPRAALVAGDGCSLRVSTVGRLLLSTQSAALLLQALCERAVATRHVEPRTALEVLHYADAAGAGALKRCACARLRECYLTWPAVMHGGDTQQGINDIQC